MTDQQQQSIDLDALERLAQNEVALREQRRSSSQAFGGWCEASIRLEAACSGVTVLALIARMRALVAALEAVEWDYCTEMGTCPWCKAVYGHGRGHAPDCQRQAALGVGERAAAGQGEGG